MKINCKEGIKNLKGENFKEADGTDTLLGPLVANVLVGFQTKDGHEALKAYSLSKKFYSEEFVEVDLPDFQIIKKAVEQSGANVLIKGQLLELLGEYKKE